MSRSQLLPGKDDDADAHAHRQFARVTAIDEVAPSASTAYASMSGFESSSAASRSTIAARRGLVGRVDRQLDATTDAHRR